MKQLVEEDVAVIKDFVATIGCRRAVITAYLNRVAEACSPQVITSLCDNCLSATLSASLIVESNSTLKHQTLSHSMSLVELASPINWSKELQRLLWNRTFQLTLDLSYVFRSQSLILLLKGY